MGRSGATERRRNCSAPVEARRVSCGSGQQPPFRAPQRVHRIRLEIVSSGVSMSSPMPLGKLVRLNHDGVRAAITVQPGLACRASQHRKVGLFQASSFGVGCQLMPAIVARFAAPGKPRGLVAPAVVLAYILKTKWASSSA